MSRYRRINAALFIAVAITVSNNLFAQSRGGSAGESYPAKPVRVIVGLAPGGATDIQARMVAQKLSDNTGRSFVVENRTGAGGTIAYAHVATSPPDGYTVLAVSSGYSITPAVYRKLSYDPIKDLVTHVPYRGTGPALIDTMSGHVHALFGNVLSSLPHARSGKLRALAVTTAKRSMVLPDLPTISESGVPGYDTSTRHGWLAPAGTPAAIVSKLSTEIAKSVKARAVAERFATDGGEPVGSTPEGFAQHLVTEIARWRKVVKETGMRVE